MEFTQVFNYPSTVLQDGKFLSLTLLLFDLTKSSSCQQRQCSKSTSVFTSSNTRLGAQPRHCSSSSLLYCVPSRNLQPFRGKYSLGLFSSLFLFFSSLFFFLLQRSRFLQLSWQPCFIRRDLYLRLPAPEMDHFILLLHRQCSMKQVIGVIDGGYRFYSAEAYLFLLRY